MDAVTTALPEDMMTMPDDQLTQTVQAGTAELERRRRVREHEQTTDDFALSYLQAQGRQQGAPFEAPVGFIGAYPRGWRVTQGSKAFEAAAPGVTTEPPGEDCWTPVDPDSPIIPFWEPGPYPKNALTRDAGQVWRALADDTDGPRPSEYPGGWSPQG